MKQFLITLSFFVLSQHLFAQSDSLSQFIASYSKKHLFNGSILVQHNNKTICQKSFGIADRRFGTPITNETEYKVASVTKAFTAVLILQLYEQGKLNLNQSIKFYLPEYRGEAGTRVTVHQLLNHTSGMQNTDTVKSIANALKYGIGFYQKPYTSDQILDQFCSSSLVNTPGKKFDYNNGEYIILGKIIEALYHKSYEEVLNDKILKPLGMHNSGMLYQNNIIKNLASTYFLRTDNNELINDLPVYMEDWYSAGAMYSCPADLILFSNALFGLKLIKQTTLDLMIKPGLDDYGYGVWIRDATGNNSKFKRVERYGSIMGANAILMHFLNYNVTIVLLSNTNMTDLGDYALNIGKALIH
jgi:CubicO group peptidase (beta-lactamase class C family)